jgi:hypothetical protein
MALAKTLIPHVFLELCSVLILGIVLLTLCSVSSRAEFVTSINVGSRESIKQEWYQYHTVLLPDTTDEELDSLLLNDPEINALLAEADSLENLLETDTIPETKWRLSLRSSLRTNQVQNGVALSNNQPVLDIGARLSHDIGLYASVTGTRRLGENGFYQQTNLMAGYMVSATNWLDLSFDYMRFMYANDLVNPLAGAQQALSFTASFYTPVVDIDISADRYFGTDKVNYLTLYLSRFISLTDDFTIIPGASIGATSFEIESIRKRPRADKPLVKTQTVRGLSAITGDITFSYNLGKSFTLTYNPMLLFAFQPDVITIKSGSSFTSQLIHTLGLRYLIKW